MATMQPVNLVILTGAGVSAESGLRTFRDGNGLWENHRVEDVATPEAFQRNPELVQTFYNQRRRQLAEVEPNAAHHALAELERRWQGDFLLVTQNVDDLHERGGSGGTHSFLHMHGELKKVRCVETGRVVEWLGDITLETPCACCREPGKLRPHIVWFGEMPLSMEAIYQRLRACDLFIAIGTSGNVYPAAGFVQEATFHAGAHTIEVNLEPSLTASSFNEAIIGPASQTVPALVQRLLAQFRF